MRPSFLLGRFAILCLACFAATAAMAQSGPADDGETRTATPDASSIRLVGASQDQLRFEGETDSHVFAVYLTGAQAAARARIHLSYNNAVSVMPEASRMKISVNDVVVAETAIASPASNDPAIIDLDIPEGLLEPGYNAIKFEVQQRHRVDCSLAATYELWTQLDPANTGLAFSNLKAESIADPSDLPALAPDGSGTTPLRLVVPKGVDAPSLERLFRAVEAIAIQGRYAHPSVEVVNAPLEAPGLDVIANTNDELKLAGLADYVNDDQALTLRPGAVPGHSVLVLSGPGPAEVDAAVAMLLRSGRATPPGTPAGVRALAISGGTPVEGGKRLTLRDLGVTSQEFSGRMFRTGFDLLMPPDFYAAEYGKITLRVDAGYVAGLDPTSQILVRVNDRDAAALALPNPRGDVFRNRPITVSLADLRPGFNHVQIEAQLPAPSDKVCDTATTVDKKRFVLLDDSGLELPSIARIAHMPSLAVTAASGFPYLAAAGETKLYIPHPDAETVGAAATFLARAAQSAGSPLPLKLIVGQGALDKGSAIVFGALKDIPAPVVDATGLDFAATREAWSHLDAKIAASARLSGGGSGAAKPATTAAAPAPDEGPREDSALFQRWSQNVSSGRWQFDPVAFLSSLLQNAVGLSRANLDPWSRRDAKYVPDAHSRLIVAQHAAPSGAGATWTMVVAPSSALLASGMRELTSPTLWNRLDGRMASLDPKARVLTVLPTSQGYFIQTAPLSPGNMRLIAAGWLSSYLEYYVLGLVALSLGLGLTTTAVVRRYGVKV